MPSQLRAVASFTGLGVVLVGAALFVTHVMPEKTGADALPPYVPASQASARVAPPYDYGLPHPGGEAPTLLLNSPTLSKTEIAFAVAGELWVVGRDGGAARPLVSGQLEDYHPVFSPDGSKVAFTGVLDQNADVYVVPAAGGEPTRLTYAPGADVALGWTPDGTKVLFRSQRKTTRDLSQLYTVGLKGGFPEELPIPSAQSATYSPEGTHLAYTPFQQWQPEWRKYRGGQTTRIWLADLSDSSIVKIPRTDSNDRTPMWGDGVVYFMSDRNGPVTLFAYDTKSSLVRELIKNPDGFDLRGASLGPGAIAYEQMGDIHLYDLAKGTTKKVPITVNAELPQVRPRFEHVTSKQVLHAAISPTGKRVLLETRGEILSAPVDKGDVRNLTRSPGVADRNPTWSPDGKWVAWLSDESGEYALFFRSPDGLGPLKKVSLGEPGSYFYAPLFSPDSKNVVLRDKRLNLWLIDLEHPTPLKVDTGRFEGTSFDPSWSPDSRFLAYAKPMENHYRAIFIYSLDDKKITQVTDGLSDADSPSFDKGGKELWFLASTDHGPAAAGGMVSMMRPVTNSVYGIVLQKDEPSPVAPESDEEGDTGARPGVAKHDKDKDEKEKKENGDKNAKKTEVKPVQIDFDGIDQRIVSLPIARGTYYGMEVGEKGVLFLASGPNVMWGREKDDGDDAEDEFTLLRFELKTRKTETFVGKMAGMFDVSADGTKVLYKQKDKYFVVPADKAAKPGDGALKLDGMEVWVDPRAEWRQIFHEVWRIERDFLYDPKAHGLDLAAAEKLYGRYLDGVASRGDLNALLEQGLGNLVLGHVWAQGGDTPHEPHVSVGLLGADYAVEEGHYRIKRILRGENWDPKVRAPLTEPGVNVKEGDFLLKVNGEALSGDDDVYRLFQERAGKQTVITVGPTSDGAGSRDVTVVPTGSEVALRLRTWMEDNKKKVDELSGGKVGYVYIPDTGSDGLTNFNRYYYSQAGKDAVVLDERFNHGGQIADYIVEVLSRKPLMGAMTREGEDETIPELAVFGPKVMIANQMSGSGGDALPWLFKNAGLGPLVGTRTWGGLVGIGGYPQLIDGGRITAPRWALYGTHGQFEVENHGITPDVEVEQDPAQVRLGHDPQLEKAVSLAMDALAKNPPKKLVRPKYPDYGDRLPKLPLTP
jgi:tricorn protease